MGPRVTIRPERAADHAAVRELLLAAFPTAAEADLVGKLRADGDAAIALVAVSEGRIAGHAVFSPMKAPMRALGLAPVAVAEDWRRRGIAARLIEAGLDRARRGGWQAVFVLGDPAYYGRFGFSAELAAGFSSPFAGPDLMALALGRRGLAERQGTVAYAAAFSAFG
jgi:putative acetyltransferase